MKLYMRRSEDESDLKTLPSCEADWRGCAQKSFECDIFLRLFVHAGERFYKILACFSLQTAISWEI